MRGEGGVAGEEFHSWGKCTMALTNINSNWISNASSGLCINLFMLFMLFICRSFISHVGV